jgi:hypothetical protein
MLEKQRLLLAKRIAGRSLDAEIGARFNTRLQVYETNCPGGPPTNPSKVMCKDNDLILDNFGLYLLSLLQPYTTLSIGLATVSLKDTGGTNRSMSAWGNASANTYVFTVIGATQRGLRIGVGIGTTPAARTNYNLETQVGSWAATSGNPTWTSATGQLSFAGSVLLADGATVTEAGAAINGTYITNSTNPYQIMMFHDVFDGVEIAVGKYAHVVGTLQL